jgi:hypothetical protein
MPLQRTTELAEHLYLANVIKLIQIGLMDMHNLSIDVICVSVPPCVQIVVSETILVFFSPASLLVRRRIPNAAVAHRSSFPLTPLSRPASSLLTRALFRPARELAFPSLLLSAFSSRRRRHAAADRHPQGWCRHQPGSDRGTEREGLQAALGVVERCPDAVLALWSFVLSV